MINSLRILFLFYTFICLPVILHAEKTVIGESIPLGNGKVTSWVKLGDDGKPLSIGITLSEGVLDGLPGPNDKGAMKLTTFPDISTFEYVLSLPTEASLTPFNHISINWNPVGHPPGCYGVKHFDFHFNMDTPQEREAITCLGDDTLRVYKTPASELIPTDYMTAPLTGEGRMGCHWFDPNSSEFHSMFSKTLIYGFYDGKMVFIEPMITMDFLKEKPVTNVSAEIKQPKAYPKSGVYYPTSYTVQYQPDTKEYVISLDGFNIR